MFDVYICIPVALGGTLLLMRLFAADVYDMVIVVRSASLVIGFAALEVP